MILLLFGFKNFPISQIGLGMHVNGLYNQSKTYLVLYSGTKKKFFHFPTSLVLFSPGSHLILS